MRAKRNEVGSGLVLAVGFLFYLEMFLKIFKKFFPPLFKLSNSLLDIYWLGSDKGWGLFILNIPTAVRVANQTRRTVLVRIATLFFIVAQVDSKLT